MSDDPSDADVRLPETLPDTIPEPSAEPCRDRQTVRFPRSTSHDIEQLVEEGRYPNRAAAIRAGVRLLLAWEEASD